MPDQQKIYKTLRFLGLLLGRQKYSNEELQMRLGLSERSIYRYLNTFERAGFVIDRTNGRYRLVAELADMKGMKDLLHFTEEEVLIFWEVLERLDASASTKSRLLRKLNTLYDIKALNKLGKDTELRIITSVREAMDSSYQIVLLSYRSSNSNKISDRTVEPFAFLPDYHGFWAFECSSRTCKQFRISRINQIEVLDNVWQYAAYHKIPFVDVFGMSTDERPIQIQLYLKLKAYNLLIEEFPLSREHLQPKDDRYILNIPVAGFQGIARFVLGLSDEIEVIEPLEFIDYLKERVRKINW